MKKCKRCNKLKPFSDYYKHKAMEDGYLNFCKECTKKRINQYRYNNIEKDREREKHRIRENPVGNGTRRNNRVAALIART